MSRAALWLLASGAILAAGCSSEGKVREPAELQDIASPALHPDEVWSESAGDGSEGTYAGLLLTVESDAVFAADTDGDVYAFDPKSGKQLWKAHTKARVISGPSVSGNAVLVGTLDAQVIALKRADGTELWRAGVGSEVMGAPRGDGDRVIARSGDGRVYGLSAVSGARLWTFDRTEPSLTLRGLSPPLISGNRVFVGMDNGRVAALGLNDGAVGWEQPVAVPSGRNELDRITDIDAGLIGDSGAIFVASFGGELVCMDGDDGNVLWRRTVKSYSGLVLTNDLVVVTDEAGVVWGLDSHTGAAAWKQEALQYRKLSAPGAIDGYVVVGDFEGYLHWLDPKDGRIVARNRPGHDPIRAAPVTGGDTLYVMNVDGKIVALKSGKKTS
jgi:outer membrane protein assembly factor BamB